MAYATQQDLIDRTSAGEVQQISDRADPPAGVIDANVVAQALSDAEAEINGYISVRVTTPVNPVPPILTQQVCAIARYRLWKDRASEKVTQDFQDAIGWAKGVCSGTIGLGNAGDTASPAPSAGAPEIVVPPRRFNSRTLRGL